MDLEPAVESDAAPMPAAPANTKRTSRIADFLARIVLRALLAATRILYRVRVEGLENLPRAGGVLVAPNHVALVDGLVLLAALPRPLRFLVDQEWNAKRWLAPFYRALNVIPVSSTGGPRVVLGALREAGAHLERGECVCIFPEGQLTRTGQMQPFRRGVERIARGRGAPIVPVHLDGLEGSLFAGARKEPMRDVRWRIPFDVRVTVGKPLQDGASAAEIRSHVQELSERAWRARNRPVLHRAFLRSARLVPWKFAVGDAVRGDLSRIRLLAAAIGLARERRAAWTGEGVACVLLPCSVAAAVAQLAAAIAGRPCVPLNFTVGRAALESAARQCGARSVLTSRAFLQKAQIELPAGLEPVFLEDVAPRIGALQRASALVAAFVLPASWLERWCGAARAVRRADVVTILFSSGSTGEPKGVPLTHDNVASNVLGAREVLHADDRDRLVWLLPPFHAFGTFSAWFGLVHGVGLLAQPSPLDVESIGRTAEARRATLLLATPTFLALYLKRVAPEQFGSLRLVMTGAEKLSERLAAAFEERFGLRPIEGYGATECAPVVAASTLPVRRRGIFQPGSRKGSVGQPLPGNAVRTVDPDTGAILPHGPPGMLLVRGANVFDGYLGRPDLTAQVLKDGWYVTGDIAVVDPDGFVRITDRLARFSKIGGEMVPHGRVEEALQTAAGVDAPSFAVTAVADEKKGERLAVLHTLDPARVPDLIAKLGAAGLPNLFIPRADAFLKVEALPVLGTGKIDLRRVKEIARERLASPAGAAS
jgi:acyl-[acyl-carrier-protein]-phospholipid O-acyltransferase/long-chain-fatty-acid--[acyl-carrier-protein] ligase